MGLGLDAESLSAMGSQARFLEEHYGLPMDGVPGDQVGVLFELSEGGRTPRADIVGLHEEILSERAAAAAAVGAVRRR